MKPMNCSACGEQPIIGRNSEAGAVEFRCKCGAFLWSPFDNADTGDRPIDELEAEAVSLWNTAQGAKPERA